MPNKFRQSLSQIYIKITQNAFLKSSGIVFFVNITAAVLNYSVPIIVSNITAKDFFPSWTALNSTVAITMVVFYALQAEFTKKTSSHSTDSPELASNYLGFMKIGLLKMLLYSIPFSPLIIYIVHIVNPTESWLLSITIVANLFFQSYAVLHSSFLMGMLKIKDFSINLLLATASRPIITTLLLISGFGLYALPLGYIGFAIIMFIHARWAIKKYNHNLSSDFSVAKEIKFEIFQEIRTITKTLFVFFVLSAFLNVSAIISERVLPLQESHLFAILFTFGQIMHFGAIAFLGAFVAYSAKGRNLKIYLTSLSAVSLITLGIGLGFWLIGPILLFVMNSTEYISQIPMILYFSLFIAFYNIIFVSAQYLVSLNDYKTIALLLIFLLVQIVLLFNSGWFGVENYSLFSFVSINILIALLATILITTKTILDHQKLTKAV